MIESIWRIVSNVEYRYPEVKALWEQLNCDAFLVGGYLRDGLEKKEGRDLDVILTCSSEELHDALDSNYLSYSQNHFGGFKVLLQKDIDIWTMDNNWAFRSGLVKLGKDVLKSLALGCFYNYDALVLNLRSGEFNVKFYEEFIKTNVLDIVVSDSRYIVENPSYYANFVRALFIKEKTKCTFSERLQEYLCYLANERIGFLPEDNARILNKMKEYSKYAMISPISSILEWKSGSDSEGTMPLSMDYEKVLQLELGL